MKRIFYLLMLMSMFMSCSDKDMTKDYSLYERIHLYPEVFDKWDFTASNTRWVGGHYQTGTYYVYLEPTNDSQPQTGEFTTDLLDMSDAIMIGGYSYGKATIEVWVQGQYKKINANEYFMIFIKDLNPDFYTLKVKVTLNGAQKVIIDDISLYMKNRQ